MRTSDDITRDYRASLLRYLPRRDEAALHTGYELGRRAVVDGVSLLELVEVHHQVLIEILQETSTDEVSRVATASAEFLIEVLATYDMSQRRPHDPAAAPTSDPTT